MSEQIGRSRKIRCLFRSYKVESMSYEVETSSVRDGVRVKNAPIKVEGKYAPLQFHIFELTQTATGYGKRITTDTMVKFKGKWRRVYCCLVRPHYLSLSSCRHNPSPEIYSINNIIRDNVGTRYIGKLSDACFISS